MNESGHAPSPEHIEDDISIERPLVEQEGIEWLDLDPEREQLLGGEV